MMQPINKPFSDGGLDPSAIPTSEEKLRAFLKADDVQVGGTHYKTMPMQPWDVMEIVLTREQFRGFLLGNVIKYSMRAGKKEGSDDAEKARHYAQKLREFDEALLKVQHNQGH